MLVLSRKIDQGIIIGHPDGNIKIVLMGLRGDKARIGIDAPASVFVHRVEVAERIEEEGGDLMQRPPKKIRQCPNCYADLDPNDINRGLICHNCGANLG